MSDQNDPKDTEDAKDTGGNMRPPVREIPEDDAKDTGGHMRPPVREIPDDDTEGHKLPTN